MDNNITYVSVSPKRKSLIKGPALYKSPNKPMSNDLFSISYISSAPFASATIASSPYPSEVNK